MDQPGAVYRQLAFLQPTLSGCMDFCLCRRVLCAGADRARAARVLADGCFRLRLCAGLLARVDGSPRRTADRGLPGRDRAVRMVARGETRRTFSHGPFADVAAGAGELDAGVRDRLAAFRTSMDGASFSIFSRTDRGDRPVVCRYHRAHPQGRGPPRVELDAALLLRRVPAVDRYELPGR